MPTALTQSLHLMAMASFVLTVAASDSRSPVLTVPGAPINRRTVGPAGCGNPNGFAQEFRSYVVDVMTSTDSGFVAERQDWQLPSVDSSQITFVADSATCDRAAIAHALRIGGDTASRPKVFVLGVGNTRYIVFNGGRVGESFLYYVFDSSFTYLSMIGS
jgi:hypothetical protein